MTGRSLLMFGTGLLFSSYLDIFQIHCYAVLYMILPFFPLWNSSMLTGCIYSIIMLPWKCLSFITYVLIAFQACHAVKLFFFSCYCKSLDPVLYLYTCSSSVQKRNKTFPMQGETKVFKGHKKTLLRLVIGFECIFPFCGLKGQEGNSHK